MSGGSQQPVTQQTTQSRDPWAAAQPSLSQIIGQSGNLFNSDTGYVPYSGQTQANLDPNVALGLASQAGIAQGMQGVGGTAGNYAAQALARNMVENQGLTPGLQTAAGQYGDIYSRALGDQNPYLQSIINQQMAKVNSAMSGAGRYGSGSHDAAIAQAIAPTLGEDYNRRQQLQMAATGSLADLYGQGLSRAGQWSQLMPSLEQAQYGPAQALVGAGEYGQSRAQAQLNDQIKQYNAAQARPWEQLSRWNAIVGGAGGLGGTQVTSSPLQQPSTLQRVLGGGLSGAGLGSIFGAPGAAVGGIGGGLLGLL